MKIQGMKNTEDKIFLVKFKYSKKYDTKEKNRPNSKYFHFFQGISKFLIIKNHSTCRF